MFTCIDSAELCRNCGDLNSRAGDFCSRACEREWEQANEWESLLDTEPEKEAA